MAIKESDKYYTLAQVKKILGATDDMVYNYVENKVLKRIIPPGKKQGVYQRKEVDQLSTDLRSFMAHRKTKPTQFLKVETLEDMIQCLEVSKAIFGPERGDITKHMKILEKNPETYYMVKDEDQVIGYTAIWPVKPEKLNSLLAQTIPVRISPEDIETFESGKSTDLYINVIGVKPIFSREEKRFYGSKLISGLVQVIVNLGARGINIETIGARSNMPEGIRLMKNIGFAEIEPLTPERRTFVIRVKESGTPFVMQYKEQFHKWQNEHKQALT
jgi:hypothetical protein